MRFDAAFKNYDGSIDVEEVAELLIYIGTENLSKAIEIANKKQWTTPQDKTKIVLAWVTNGAKE